MPETNEISKGVRQITVTGGFDGQRIDNYLLNLLKGVPRSYVYRILRRGEVRVNKGRIRAGYRLQLGDVVRIPPLRMPEKRVTSRPSGSVAEQLGRAVLLETDGFLVINKPSGMAVHGGSGLSFGLIESLRQLRTEGPQLELVHRLDRETSGCLLVSKKRSALRILHELMRNGDVDKRYLVLLAGRFRDRHVEVKVPLKKNTLRSGERVVRVDAAGKSASTRFRCLERFSEATLVEAELVTGRTHQIRVHSAYLGTPVLGDTKYGDDAANRRFRERGLRRLFLHAASVRFRWPEGDREILVEAPLEKGLEQLLSELRYE